MDYACLLSYNSLSISYKTSRILLSARLANTGSNAITSGLQLNNTIILNAIGYGKGQTIYHTLRNTAVGSLVLACAGSLPGYWLSVFTVDTLGRKSIQIVGFFILTGLFCVIGFAYKILSSGALLALYILAQVFFNFGPNTTTFLIPGECFPTRYRSTGHGISAASGKIGAIVAQVMAPPLLSKGAPTDCKGADCQPWLNHLMQIFALFMLCGTLVSFLVPETKGRTLEELAGEFPDDRRNGSLRTRSEESWWSDYIPFRGGKPAGFNSGRSPNLLPRTPGIRGKRERVGIMTSPDLLPRKGEKGKRNAKARSFESGSGDAYSVSSNGRQMDADDDGYLSGAAGGVLPGWSAGWGVQRGPRRDERVESIVLQDVGSLLK